MNEYKPSKTVAATFEPNARFLRDLAILHANQGDHTTAQNIAKIADRFELEFEVIPLAAHYDRVNELLRSNNEQQEQARAARRQVAVLRAGLRSFISHTLAGPSVGYAVFAAKRFHELLDLTPLADDDHFQEVTDELAESILRVQRPDLTEVGVRHELPILADHIRTVLHDELGL